MCFRTLRLMCTCLNNCKQVVPRRCPLPYLVAVHHTNRFIYTQDNKHNKLKNMYKTTTLLQHIIRIFNSGSPKDNYIAFEFDAKNGVCSKRQPHCLNATCTGMSDFCSQLESIPVGCVPSAFADRTCFFQS